MQVSEILTSNTINNNNIVNVNNNNNKTINNKTLQEVRLIVEQLQQKLPSASANNFYYKIAWRLAEYKIWSNLEQAKTGTYPAKYFSFLCNLDMKKPS